MVGDIQPKFPPQCVLDMNAEISNQQWLDVHAFAISILNFDYFLNYYYIGCRTDENLGGAGIFLSVIHSVTYSCSFLKDCREVSAHKLHPSPPLLPQCATRLIITTEITDSHSNLDIFRGVGMMTRLCTKWEITLSSATLSLQSSLS